MHKYSRTLMGTAAVAVLGVAVIATNAHYARAQDTPTKKEKAPKDTGEYDIYNEVIKDANPQAPNPKKLLTDLDTWTQKYPTSDFKSERVFYYLQGYAGTNQPGKALDTAKDLLAGGLEGLKTGLGSPPMILQALYFTAGSATAAASTGSPTPDQLESGSKAAHMLMDYGKEFFAPDKKPAAQTAAEWAQGLKQVNDAANGALLQIALYPGTSQLKKDAKGTLTPESCATSEPAFVKALQDYPDSGQLALQLATVLRCQQTATPAKAQQAIYEYARAVALPTGVPWGLEPANQKAIDDYLKGVYTRFHGSDEGLAQLKELALKTPLPPADFKIKSAGEIALGKQQEFQEKNPQLAMWMSIKGQLVGDGGQQYFDTQLKDADVKGPSGAKALKGTIVGAHLKGKPAPGMCRPDALLMAVPLPDQTGAPVAEITLKLVTPAGEVAPLTGKVEAGEEIQWDGVPSAFTKDPFMLTMDADKAKIEGMKVTPCAPPVTRPPVTKKGGGAAPPPAKKKG